MPTHTQTDASLTLTLNGVEVACQVINASYQMAAPGDSTPVPVACGQTVSEPGDASNGAISGEVFKDTSEGGITRMLAEAALSGASMDYTYVETDGTDSLAWSGACTVPAFGIDFQPSRTGRHPLNLSLTTSVLAPVVVVSDPPAEPVAAKSKK